MNLDSLSFTLSQISYLVASLNKKNHKQVVADLTKLVCLHGLEADRHLLQCLFSSVDFSESTNKILTTTTQNTVFLEQCSNLLNKPSLLSSVCYITDSPVTNYKGLKVGPQFFQQLSKCLRLTAVQEVVFAIAFRHSSNAEVASLAFNHLRTCVPNLVHSYVNTQGSSAQHEGGLHETTPEILHIILTYLGSVLKSPKEVGLTSESHNAFLSALQRDFPRDLVPVVLAPLVYPEQCELAPDMASEGPPDTQLSDLISEIGYSFTSSLEECRASIIKLSGGITAGVVARTLGVMCRTHTGLEPASSTWNIDVFVQSIKEVAPNLQWSSVVVELDHPDFVIKDRQGLIILISALRQGLQTGGFHPETFPIDQFYKRWSNSEGQLSLISNILKNSDVFCFADFPCLSVSVDVLKTPPEQDSKDLANWRSLNLIELLLGLSERNLYNHVTDTLKHGKAAKQDTLLVFKIFHPETFPIDQFYKRWSNSEGQLSLISNILKNSDVFCFADFPCLSVSVDVLKTPPEQDSKDLANWRSLNLIELLLGLSEGNLYNHVTDTLKHGNFHPETFPIDQFYKRWSNSEGQLSLISNILKNSDVFCFADFPCLSVSVDVLKTPPEQDSKDLANWRSLNLIELLLGLSERNLYNHVTELFKIPMHNCPDVLVLALLQINGPVTVLRQELLTSLIPIFLVNHPNSAIILHHAWHTQTLNIKPIIMHAMAEWYVRGECDQTRLSRILDVAQDLKALSMLLNAQNAQSYPFIIDLACLASRREYLKLEKWLTDKIREHGEGFVTACIKFLHRRCPQIGKGEDALQKIAPLPTETVANILICLQNAVPSVSLECQEAIMTITTNCTMLMKRTQPAAILRPRVQDNPFNPSAAMGGQLYNHSTVDGLAGLATNLSNINLSGPASSAFNLQGGLGPLVPSPGSPSRIISAGPSNSPFPMMPMQHQNQQVGTSGSLVLGVNQMNNLTRMNSGGSSGGQAVGPAANIDKNRLPDYNLFPDIPPNLSKDIEDEANSYFQRIYNHPPHPTLSIDEVLDMLKRFQDSNNKREREVFNCMLRNLFEEYKFFPQYPDKELHITAQLFGGIIERGIVTSYVALGLALRFVLDALKKSEGSKMYYFGIAALDRFKSRLKEYHKYCEHVRAIPHFGDFPAHLQEYVEYGLQSREPPNKPEGPVLPASLATMLAPPNAQGQLYKGAPGGGAPTPSKTILTSTAATSSTLGSRPSIANATNIDTLLVATEKEEKVILPPENVQDKTAFIFNNLSQLNLKTKCEELRELLTDEYYCWMSQYLVMKRASIELNFHGLYSNFLDTLNIIEIYRMVTAETFRNIKVLLKSDKGIANFSDRSLLKNLGHWLGMLTLGRNRPILQNDLDLKSLLVEAYNKGQQELLYVVPFVAKVIESCAKSKVFKSPNPWTMAIMNVLAELHQEPDLKLNLKFEIEVLCKNLDIDVSHLKPAVYLKDPDRIRKIEYQLSQQPKKDAVQTSSQSVVGMNEVELANMMQGQASSSPVAGHSATPTSATPSPPDPRFNYGDIQLASMVAINAHTMINPSILIFQSTPQLKNCVKPAIERAVQEWIGPVVDRSIKIALQTCEQIIRKDFVLDGDENRMRLAAHCMVRNLTAGMAMITCRDQLLSAINTNCKQALLNQLNSPTVQQKEMVEQAAAVIATDNMELACAVIQKTAVEKAIPEIDKRLMNDYELRKLARQEGRAHYDQAAYSYQMERMPEPIRLRGNVTTSQMVVYEEFARNIPGFLASERDAQLLMQKHAPPQSQLPPPPSNIQPESVVPPNSVVGGATGAYPTSGGVAVVQPVGVVSLTEDLMLMFEKLLLDMEQFIQATQGQTQYSHMNGSMAVLSQCLMHTLRTRDFSPPQPVLQKCVETLQDCLVVGLNETDPFVLRFKEVIIRLLKSLQDPRLLGQPWVIKFVTRVLMDCRDEFRYNIDATDTLIKSGLVNLPQFDMALASLMDSGSNYMAVNFAMQLIQLYLIDDRTNQCVTEADLPNSIDVLAKIQTHARSAPEGLGNIIDVLRHHHDTPVFGERYGPNVHIHNGILQVSNTRPHPDVNFKRKLLEKATISRGLVRNLNYEDPPGLVEKTDFLLREWISIYNSQPQGRDTTKPFTVFVHQMNIHGILKTDDLITRFFRLSTQICVENVYRNLSEKGSSSNLSMVRAKCYHTLDPFVKLVALLVKHSGEASNTNTKIHLLNKVLGIVAGCLLQDHETRSVDFQQLPYHRIFTMLFLELNAAEPVLETINFHVLTAYCHTLHILRPTKAAGFCYAWLELVSHRVFMGRMLASTPHQKLCVTVLGIVAGCLLQDHETRSVDFQQLPYHRIFTMLFLELNAAEPVLETINFHVLTAYCHTLHILRPTKAAGFCYAWLELVSHRVFMGRMLASTPHQKGWPLYAQLLIDLLKYLAPFLRNAELAKPVTMLYKGSLRVLLVLLHDFPEFLCDYHYGFCDVIPPNCIQMRNLILSAFPRNMRLPDPFTPNLKVDLLPEITYAPRILTNLAVMITPQLFKKELDSYLKARAPVTFLSDLRSNLQVSNGLDRYNIPLMNALVLYVGTQAIAYIRAKGHTPNMSTIAHSAHMDIFQNLAVDLDTEGRYLFLNAIANQLRYPNSHTHYFSCTLLYLFSEANSEAIQEQITRVLLERLIVNRPHPWGLLITFIELIKNPTYKFWSHEFVHCAPEIEKLFESVARSCMVQKTVQPVAAVAPSEAEVQE